MPERVKRSTPDLEKCWRLVPLNFIGEKIDISREMWIFLNRPTTLAVPRSTKERRVENRQLTSHQRPTSNQDQ